MDTVFDLPTPEEEFAAAFRDIVAPRGNTGASLEEIIAFARERDCEPLCPREAARAAVARCGGRVLTTAGGVERYFAGQPAPAAPVGVDGRTPMERAEARYGPSGTGEHTKTACTFAMIRQPSGATARQIADALTARGQRTSPNAVSQMLSTLRNRGLIIDGDPDEVISGGRSLRYRLRA